jgi:hypothetical protein
LEEEKAGNQELFCVFKRKSYEILTSLIRLAVLEATNKTILSKPNSIKFREFTKFHGIPWNFPCNSVFSMEFHGIPRNSINLSSMKFHGRVRVRVNPRNSMEFNINI